MKIKKLIIYPVCLGLGLILFSGSALFAESVNLSKDWATVLEGFFGYSFSKLDDSMTKDLKVSPYEIYKATFNICSEKSQLAVKEQDMRNWFGEIEKNENTSRSDKNSQKNKLLPKGETYSYLYEYTTRTVHLYHMRIAGKLDKESREAFLAGFIIGGDLLKLAIITDGIPKPDAEGKIQLPQYLLEEWADHAAVTKSHDLSKIWKENGNEPFAIKYGKREEYERKLATLFFVKRVDGYPLIKMHQPGKYEQYLSYNSQSDGKIEIIAPEKEEEKPSSKNPAANNPNNRVQIIGNKNNLKNELVKLDDE
jgi:hypothetical protein